MSAEVNPSLVNWLTSMMSMRLHVILDHNPVTEDQIQHYVLYTQVRFSYICASEFRKLHLCTRTVLNIFLYLQPDSDARPESNTEAVQQTESQNVEVRADRMQEISV